MPCAPSDLISTCITVECLTVTAGPVWGNRDLTAAIAVTVGLLGATKEAIVKGRGEGNLGPFESLWKRRRGRKRERGRDKSYIKNYSGTNIINYMSKNELAYIHLGVFIEHNTARFSHA